jgi:chaperonin cofactor prefoldin
MTLEQHLKNNAAKIQAEAIEYAASYKCDLETALDDVRDAYAEGWHLDNDERLYNEGGRS